MRQRQFCVTDVPIRLLIITQFYPPDFAATGQLIEELAHQLGQHNFQVTIFTGQPGYAFSQDSAPHHETIKNVSIVRSQGSRWLNHRIRGKALNGLLFLVRAIAYLFWSVWHQDVILLTTAPPYLLMIGYLLKWIFKRPYFCILYDLYPDIAVQLKVISPQHWLTKLWRKVNQFVWRNAEQIIVLSPNIKQKIIQQYGIPAHQISMIHSWADPTVLRPYAKQDNWFARQHQLDRTFTVLYSGNMGRCHDMATILDAIALLKDEPIQFVFIGDGAKRSHCQQVVQQRHLQNCLFLPYQDKETLPYSLSAGDVALVSVERGFEGLVAPSKLYGYLATARPVAVICEPQSYLRSLIAQAGCGASVDPGDSAGLASVLRQLAAHPQRAQAMGQSGRAYLERHFTPSMIAHQYAQVIIQHLQRRSPGRASDLPNVPLPHPVPTPPQEPNYYIDLAETRLPRFQNQDSE
jgi:glycosyltransferase involved in cell wall biosynthesis